MKKIFFAAAILLFAACGTQKGAISKHESTRIASYFDATFTNSDNGIALKKKIDTEKIDAARSEVWKLWSDAVVRNDGNALPETGLLADKETTYWQIPDSLEPNATMPFYWGVNADAVPEGKLPMFLHMHGSGPKDYEWKVSHEICMHDFPSPAIYMIPQIPNGYGEYYRWAIVSKQWAWEKLLRHLFLNEKVDANRIHFIGISEGAYGSQRLASFYADYLAGAGPMAGGEPLRNAPLENLAHVAFSLRSGEWDFGFHRNTVTYMTRIDADSIQELHPGYYNHLIEIVPDYGHSIPYGETPKWLYKFTRTPRPKYFYWEDYDMYGRHREGFYNLRVDEISRSSDAERTCYEMNIDGNTITLNVNNVQYKTTFRSEGIDFLFAKEFTPATKGKVTLFLSEDMVDFSKPVNVIVNGKEVFSGKVKPALRAMVESCALFYDPERLFPASVEVVIK